MRIFKVLLVKLQIVDRRQCTMCECDRCYLSNKHSFFNFIYVDYLVPILADCKYFVTVLYGALGVRSSEFGVRSSPFRAATTTEFRVTRRNYNSTFSSSSLPTPNSQLPNFLVKIHSLRCSNHVDGVNETGSFGLTRNN